MHYNNLSVAIMSIQCYSVFSTIAKFSFIIHPLICTFVHICDDCYVIVYFQFHVKNISALLLIISNVMQNNLRVLLKSIQCSSVLVMIAMSLCTTNPMKNTFHEWFLKIGRCIIINSVLQYCHNIVAVCLQ